MPREKGRETGRRERESEEKKVRNWGKWDGVMGNRVETCEKGAIRGKGSRCRM